MNKHLNIFDTFFEYVLKFFSYILIYISSLYFDKKETTIALLIFIAFDIVTGIIASIKEGKRITSDRMLHGLFFKVFMLFMVSIISIIAMRIVKLDIYSFFILLGCIVEFISIRENILRGFKIDIYKFLLIGFDGLKSTIKKAKDLKNEIDEFDKTPSNDEG